jgi:hypothetical protein
VALSLLRSTEQRLPPVQSYGRADLKVARAVA